MGIKSTFYLTRKEAEDKYVELKHNITERKLRSKAAKLTDQELEIKLEKMNDSYYRKEFDSDTGTNNYIIKE